MEKEDLKNLFGPKKQDSDNFHRLLDWDDFKKEYQEIENEQKQYLDELNKNMENFNKLFNQGSLL